MTIGLFPSLAGAATQPSDELVFINGERLIGQLEQSDNTTVCFKSEMAGEIKVPWSKVKKLQTGTPFAIIPKGTKFGRRHRETQDIPEGQFTATASQIEVKRAEGTVKIPLDQTAFLVDRQEFDQSLERPNIFAAWKGLSTSLASEIQSF